MPEITPEIAAAYARHERQFGLQRLRLGCWIAMALTPPGVVIDLLYYFQRPEYEGRVYLFTLMRLACSAAVLPILELSGRPFGARHFRLLGVLLALAPAFCMAWIIYQTDRAASPYYAGLNLVLLGIGILMHWTTVQSLSAALIVFMLYLGAVVPLRPAVALAEEDVAYDELRPFLSTVLSSNTPAGNHYSRALSANTRNLWVQQAAEPPGATNDVPLLRAVVKDLNTFLQEDRLPKNVAFPGVKFSPKTLSFVTNSPKSSLGQTLLNRYVFDDSFPDFVVRPGHVQESEWGIFLSNIWFMLLTAIIVVIGSQISGQLRFSDFVSGYNLEKSSRDLAVSNERLNHTNRQLEETNNRLLELDKLKGHFFANISHELRTPLTLLLGPIENLARHPVVQNDERLRENVGTMQDNGLRLLKLINDLLELVRLEASKGGMGILKPVQMDPLAFVTRLMSAVRPYAEDRGLRVSGVCSPDLQRLIGDPERLEKVFLNLLFNSIKFTPAGGEVRLTAVLDGDTAVFEVADTGMGIAPEHLQKVFERFWQVDSSAHRKFQGAGIGLALVKELVEAHGGEVKAASTVGRGTTMTVRLPISGPPGIPVKPGGEERVVSLPVATGLPPAPPPEVPKTADGDAAMGFETRRHLEALYRRAELHASITPLRASLRPWDGGRGGSRPEVLVVDDEPDMLRFLRSQLEDHYQVREAVDGEQAISMASQYLPDAVVCDMMLPEKDGLQVCRELRQNHTTRAIPFLMLTARADDETKLAALSSGASDFLPKPFSTAELKLRLKNLVDAQRLQKELTVRNKELDRTLRELRDMESQLVQAEKMASLGRLSAGIIHEINNPLNFARTGLHVLARHGKQLPEETQEEFGDVLTDIREGITRVAQIVGDLRQFSHPQADAVSEVDVAAAVEASMRFLAADWKDGRAELINEVPAGFTVFANRNKLVQILLNLCTNSFDAMRDNPPSDGRKPTLRLRAWRANGRRYVSVRDNGPGISESHLGHIFEPFYTTKEVGKGMGLGLSICYRIMEEVGGKIAVETEVGKFCEFILDFPDRLEDKEPSAIKGPNGTV